ncbi:hypothetical protein EDC94DRAFT_598579 [Helicostylum pulchrum]|nr:hypothetical protein EDC94DRAFT_598579 [Helicostylum pulchrum]
MTACPRHSFFFFFLFFDCFCVTVKRINLLKCIVFCALSFDKLDYDIIETGSCAYNKVANKVPFNKQIKIV